MCSIMGFCDRGVTVSEFKRFFDRTISRGPDDSRIIDTGKGLLGFHRLAIMDLSEDGMQPFSLDGDYVVCNGELYGFRKGCSPSSWTAAMWSATAKFIASPA